MHYFPIALLFFTLASRALAVDEISNGYSPKDGDRWEFRAEITDRTGRVSTSDALEGEFAAEFNRGEIAFSRFINGTEYAAAPRSCLLTPLS
ncbi:MAG: hypothetical protein HY695_39075 [Deltaproteobacteria bacterium]|nr:hypothetical protein [Deltaproteobacteria bacterium]